MRILIVSTFFPPLNSIASLRPYSWAKYWTIMGHDITVLTVKRDLDSSEEMALPNPGFKVIEIPLPHIVVRVKGYFQRICSTNSQGKELSWGKKCLRWLATPIRKVINYLRSKRGILSACRMPDLMHFWVKPALRRIQEEGEWDLVVSSSGPYPVHLVAEKLKKQGLTKKWIADFQDPWNDNHIYPGLFPFTSIEKRLEKRLMRHADAITTVTMGFAVRLTALHGSEKIYTVENGFDPIDMESLSPESIFPADGKYRIVYTGTIYYGKQNLIPFFKAISELRDDATAQHLLKNLEVIFVGPKQSPLRKMISHYQIDPWVRSEGFVSRDRALRLQRDANTLLFFPWNDPRTDGTLTGKIYEYLFSCTPIMAVGRRGTEPSQQLIMETKAGDLLADAEQVKRFLITQLKAIPKKKNNIDPSFLHRYDRKSLAIRLLDIAQQSIKSE